MEDGGEGGRRDRGGGRNGGKTAVNSGRRAGGHLGARRAFEGGMAFGARWAFKARRAFKAWRAMGMWAATMRFLMLNN